MRLDKFVAQAADLARQQAQKAVRAGEVCIDGAVVKKPEQHIRPESAVTLCGETLQLLQPRYFMLHKPQGYVCANSDGHYPVVLDLLREPQCKRLQIAGRLDVDTTGLVLITDDGQWNHRVTSPSRHCKKVYIATLNQSLSGDAVDLLRDGVLLDGEKKRTKPAQISFINEQKTQIRLAIHEGKYHQVKRMFAAVGNHVHTLHRESIGDIVLEANLELGQYRALTVTEIASVFA